MRVSLARRALPDGGEELVVSAIGRHLASRADGVEAGLYRCRASVFSRLVELHSRGKYFSVAQAMQLLADDGKLGATLTAGRSWFAFETRDQLESTLSAVRAAESGRAQFPWRVRMARADSFSSHLHSPPLGEAAALRRPAAREGGDTSGGETRLVLALPSAVPT